MALAQETYVRLTAPITPQSTERLLQVIDQKHQSGIKRLNLLLSTPGGSVAHGIALYNFLQGIPMEVATHNFGTVDSIGIIIFCAGTQRYSVSHARFFLHPVGLDIVGPTRVDEHWLLEHTQSLKIDQTNIARIIAVTTGRDEVATLEEIGARKTLDPEQAIDYGLVTKIQSEVMPPGADFVPIYESEAQPKQPLAGPTIQIAATPPPAVAPPLQDSSSSIYEYGAIG